MAELASRPIEGLAGAFLVAPSAAAPADGPWSRAAEAFLKDAFRLARSAGPALRRSKGFFVTVSRLDGAFGLAGDAFDPAFGALAGLAKTAAREWPETLAKALDVQPDWNDDAAASAVLGELGSRELEIGLSPSGRKGLVLVDAPLAETAPPFAEGDVVVVSGGARGVTAECALTLARACRPTLVLLGRTPEPSPEPAWLEGLRDEAAIKAAILARGEEKTPKAIEAAFRSRMANREALETLRRLRAAGSKVRYVSVDIRDGNSVRDALDGVRREVGPIAGLLHGAGVLADKKLEEKTDEQFDSVFGTKVDGLRSLLDACRGERLKALVLFSSVTGRFGRAGQADYAMANELLNKLAQAESRRRDGRVVSINWGPWDGGMVTPALKRFFESEGAAVIPLADGADALVRELAAADRAAETVVTADAAPSGKQAPGLELAFEREVSVETHPFLASHVLGGRAVLPLAVTLEWLAHGALHPNPGFELAGLDGLRVTKGVALNGAPEKLQVLAGRAREEGGLLRVPVELRSGGERGVLHAKAEALLARRRPGFEGRPLELRAPPYGSTIEATYRDRLFHGEALRGLQAVEGCSSEGISARLAAAPAPEAWMRRPVRSSWLADPLALDAAFQMMIVWTIETKGAPSLPVHVGRYRQYAPFPKSGVRAVARATRSSESLAAADIDFFDLEGRVVARIEGYECAIDPSLAASFRRGGRALAV